MTGVRESVRDTARYLQHVRPIDPEELTSYVEGQPHPAVVTRHLRDLAVELGLVERADGTFVPVGDSPLTAPSLPVERVPERYERLLEDWLAERYGPDWYDGASGDLLRSTIRRFKADYLAGRPVEYDEDVAAGYAIYHFPGYYAAMQYALMDVLERELLSRHLRVLDVGAGIGGPALGLFDLLPDDALIEYHAVEPSAAADVLEHLLDATGRNVHVTVHRETAESFDPAAVNDGRVEPGFDLVCCCNVLSELADPESILERYLGALRTDGTLLAMAPADKETAIQLRRLERALEGRSIEPIAQDDATASTVTVFGPTVRLWPGETPADRGWTFDVRPDLVVPSFQRRLEETAGDESHTPGEFENVDVQFAWSVLRLDGTRRIDLTLDPGRVAKMGEMDEHVTNRIDLVAAKLSHSLSGDAAGSSRHDRRDRDGGRKGHDGGRRNAEKSNPLFKISDGSERVDHYAVLTRETALNRPLLDAGYGDVLSFESTLVLWNDDEAAYNLVVDEETIVDRIA